MTPVRQTVFGADGNCVRAAVASIIGCDIDFVIDVLAPELVEADWFDNLVRWGAARGWSIEAVGPEEPPSGYSIAVGRTSRSPDLHAVVALDGALHFDPHPTDAMLDSVKYFIIVRPNNQQAEPATLSRAAAGRG